VVSRVLWRIEVAVKTQSKPDLNIGRETDELIACDSVSLS